MNPIRIATSEVQPYEIAHTDAYESARENATESRLSRSAPVSSTTAVSAFPRDCNVG